MIKDILYSALGITSILGKKLKSTVDELIKSGDISKEEGEKLFNSLQEKIKKEGSEIEELIESAVKKSIKKIGLVTKEEFESLSKKIDELSKK